MSLALDKDLPPTPRTHRASLPIVVVPSHPYVALPPSQIHPSPVVAHFHPRLQPLRFVPTVPTPNNGSDGRKKSHDQYNRLEHQRQEQRSHFSHRPPLASPSRIQTKSGPHVLNCFRKYPTSRRLIYLPIFIPLPPLFSLLYLVTGHAILQINTSSAHWSSPLLPSVYTGATGGAVLSLPLFFLFCLFLPISPSSPTREAQEDFFDDSFITASPVNLAMRARIYAGCFCCGALMLGLGSAAGPIGVTCLAGKGYRAGMPVMLTPVAAAVAGALGGVVCWAGLLITFTTGFKFYEYVLSNR
ncbi:hypothetical protein L208DRAFT_541727 [Tricholoma matsutake]|nr:hypothetical protein L208DRAFT_541727 [Tricholoma matsutake 945]